MKFIKAVWLPIKNNFYSQKPAAYDGLILHVQEGDNSLHDYFSEPTTKASSYFWTSKLGRLEQYLDPADQVAWAQEAGNSTYMSIETEGYGTEDLTLAQIFALAKLYKWGHRVYGWPFRLAEKPGEKGFGWHGMGGNAWGGHFDCPGDLRKAKRKLVLSIARGRLVRVSKKKYPELNKQLTEFKKNHKIKNRTAIIGTGVRKAAGI